MLGIPPDLPASIDGSAAGDGDIFQTLTANHRRARLLYCGPFPFARPLREVIEVLAAKQNRTGFKMKRNVAVHPERARHILPRGDDDRSPTSLAAGVDSRLKLRRGIGFTIRDRTELLNIVL